MDALNAIVNSTTSPLGILANLVMVFYAKNCVPPLPAAVAWVQTNFFTRTFLVGLMIYKSNVVGNNLQLAMLIAAGSIAGLNLLNNQPALGDISFGGLKLPF